MARTRNVILGAVAGIILVLGGAVVVVPPLLFSDGVDYSHAASIKATHDYQDAALLERAWALPVAASEDAQQATILSSTGLRTFFGLRLGGVTLDQLADVVQKKSGKRVTVLRDLSLEQFRAEMQRTNDPALRYIVNFHRGPLFATGGGHHSPIGGYLAAEDLVLVVDVNAKYKPWLVPTARLFAAVDTVDKATGKKRGLLRIE